MSYGQKTVIESSTKYLANVDAVSNLIKDRIIFIDGAITEEMANGVIAQMLHLDAQDKNKTIHIYINSYGGSVNDGLAIYDISQIISSPIRTVCIGKAFSMGAFLLLMGDERCSTENSRIMLHQPSGGTGGTLKDMEIDLEEGQKLRSILYKIVTDKTKIENPSEEFARDKYYSAEEALNIGIITKIVEKSKK